MFFGEIEKKTNQIEVEMISRFNKKKNITADFTVVLETISNCLFFQHPKVNKIKLKFMFFFSIFKVHAQINFISKH
jgi:hypothetical protein